MLIKLFSLSSLKYLNGRKGRNVFFLQMIIEHPPNFGESTRVQLLFMFQAFHK